MTAADGEACAVVATAADIICSLRGADLAGWTPPWRKHEPARDGGGQKEQGCGGDDDAKDLAWPAVARGKRSRSSRRESPSASGSAASADAKEEEEKKKARRGARGSPASPMDYSGGSGSGSGSGASTSGGEDGAFSSQPDAPPAEGSGGSAMAGAVEAVGSGGGRGERWCCQIRPSGRAQCRRCAVGAGPRRRATRACSPAPYPHLARPRRRRER